MSERELPVSEPPPHDPPPHEQPWRASFDAGDLDAVATATLKAYGPEILGMLFATCRSPDLASEAYAQFCEDLWRGLPGFGWRCSMRTWAYRVAQNARNRLAKRPAFQARKNLSLGHAPGLQIAAEEVRTATLPHLRTTMKGALQQVREGLDPEDQALLILRLDRSLSWQEIAQILGDQDPDAGQTPAQLKAEAARFRKRFSRLKERLKAEMLARQVTDAQVKGDPGET